MCKYDFKKSMVGEEENKNQDGPRRRQGRTKQRAEASLFWVEGRGATPNFVYKPRIEKRKAGVFISNDTISNASTTKRKGVVWPELACWRHGQRRQRDVDRSEEASKSLI